ELRLAAAAEARARAESGWRTYFQQKLNGGDAEVDAATAAAMRTLERGADVNWITLAGLEGARGFRTRAASPVPASADAAEARARAERERSASPWLGHGAVPAPVNAPRPLASVGSATSGIVFHAQIRREMFNRMYRWVYSFRLERTDSAGNPMTPIL